MKSEKLNKQAKLFELIEALIAELPVLVPKGGHVPKATQVESKHEFEDPRTGAKLTHIHTTLLDFIKVSDLKDNFFQRKLQNHLSDKIYKNLILSILQGHLIPELRVAVLANKSKVRNFDLKDFKAGQYKVSIIDGLQRYCCFLIALFLALKGKDLVKEGIISPAAYQEFADHLNPKAVSLVLEAPIRLEIYYNIEIKDLLKYMIIFNTAQRRMSLNHQLEIMEGTILQNLQENHKAQFVRDNEPGVKRNKFNGADLVLALQSYLQQDHTLSKSSTTDDLFQNIRNDESLVDDKIDEISKGIAFITNRLHPIVHDFYAETDEVKYMNILPNSISTFLVPMLASLGTYVERQGSDQALICKSLNRIADLFKKGEDVFALDTFYEILADITSSRSSTIKNLTERAFRDFWFDKSANHLDWKYALKATKS